MNRKEAKEFYPILQAYAEGKVIESRTKPSTVKGTDIPNDWTEMKEIEFWNNIEYRVKPEQKYRPFRDAKECWQEMQKHQPFGWIKNGGYWYNIITTGVMSVKIIDTRGAITTLYFSDLLAHYRFADGTPFGVKTEEG